MVDIFEEVDEELRKDKYQELLRKYGPWALGGAIGIIAVAAGYQWWQAFGLSQREASSEAYIAAIRASSPYAMRSPGSTLCSGCPSVAPNMANCRAASQFSGP